MSKFLLSFHRGVGAPRPMCLTPGRTLFPPPKYCVVLIGYSIFLVASFTSFLLLFFNHSMIWLVLYLRESYKAIWTVSIQLYVFVLPFVMSVFSRPRVAGGSGPLSPCCGVLFACPSKTLPSEVSDIASMMNHHYFPMPPRRANPLK